MKFGIFGTGMVGQAIGRKLVALGHDVKMGARDAKNEKATAFVKECGASASQGTFADAARFGEILVNATQGAASSAASCHLRCRLLLGSVNTRLVQPMSTACG
jgi:predicted dinucleotide-binding enzyme